MASSLAAAGNRRALKVPLTSLVLLMSECAPPAAEGRSSSLQKLQPFSQRLRPKKALWEASKRLPQSHKRGAAGLTGHPSFAVALGHRMTMMTLVTMRRGFGGDRAPQS